MMAALMAYGGQRGLSLKVRERKRERERKADKNSRQTLKSRVGGLTFMSSVLGKH